MRTLVLAAIGMVIVAPAMAQNLGDVGRLLQEQVAPRPGPDPRQQERDRAIYEQGRREGNDTRREELRGRDSEHNGQRRLEGRGRDDRRDEFRRSDGDERSRRDLERRRVEEDRRRTGRY